MSRVHTDCRSSLKIHNPDRLKEVKDGEGTLASPDETKRTLEQLHQEQGERAQKSLGCFAYLQCPERIGL